MIKKIKLLFLFNILKNECDNNFINKKIIIGSLGFITVSALYWQRKKIKNFFIKKENHINNNNPSIIHKNNEENSTEEINNLCNYKNQLGKEFYDFFKKNNLLDSLSNKYIENSNFYILDFKPDLNYQNKNISNYINQILDMLKMANKNIKIKNFNITRKNNYLLDNIEILIIEWEKVKNYINNQIDEEKNNNQIDEEKKINKIKNDLFRNKNKLESQFLLFNIVFENSGEDILYKIIDYKFSLIIIEEKIRIAKNIEDLNKDENFRNEINKLEKITLNISEKIEYMNIDNKPLFKFVFIQINEINKTLSSLISFKKDFKKLII